MRNSDPVQDARLVRSLGFVNLAIGCALVAGAIALGRIALAPIGLALTTVGVSVLSISRSIGTGREAGE